MTITADGDDEDWTKLVEQYFSNDPVEKDVEVRLFL